FLPLSSCDRLPPPGGDVFLLTHLVVREDGHTLYGFATADERDLFRLLIDTANGIAPRLAPNLLSGRSPCGLRTPGASAYPPGLARRPGARRRDPRARAARHPAAGRPGSRSRGPRHARSGRVHRKPRPRQSSQGRFMSSVRRVSGIVTPHAATRRQRLTARVI